MTSKEAQRIADLTGQPYTYKGCTYTKGQANASDICLDANGQYGHGFEAVCTCGRTKGAHLAVRPWPQDDTSDGFPACLGFKRVSK